jgi:hypothetical protein
MAVMGTRHRYSYAVIAMVVLIAAAAAANGPQKATPADITGMYFCEGTNSDGSAYNGIVTISRRADAYYLWWELQPAITAVGVGLREGDTLGVSYYGPNTGVIVYRIEGDRLIGRWTVPGAEDIASETLTPIDEAPPSAPRQRPVAPGGSGAGLPIRL